MIDRLFTGVLWVGIAGIAIVIYRFCRRESC